MITRKTIQKTISFFIWAALLVTAVVLPSVFNYQLWTFLAGLALPLLRLAYEHFDNFNLAVNRCFLWLFNKEVAWDMKATLVGDYSTQDLDTIAALVIKNDKSAKILHDGDFEKTITISDLGATIKISVNSVRSDEGEHQSQISLAVARVFTPFRHNTIILNSLTRILANVRQVIEIEQETYSFSAIFLDENPYLGLFLRTMKLPDSANLNVDYSEAEGVTQGRVSVKKNKIVVMTHSLDSLQALSKKYITLSSLNLSSV